MAIITISRGSYSKGKEVAERVAQKLGYRCIAREVILEASKEFNIPEVKLTRAIRNAPSILDRFTYGREKYIAYFQSAFFKQLRSDNVVYHGLAGHFFVRRIPHAVKVRIIVGLEERIKLEMAREGISREEALALLKRDDEERRKWSLHLYGIDTTDSSLYDLVLHIQRLTVDDAAELIGHVAGRECFKTSYESQKALDDLATAAEVKAALIHLKPDLQVSAHAGRVFVGTRATRLEESGLIRQIERIAGSIPGVRSVEFKLAHLVEWAD